MANVSDLAVREVDTGIAIHTAFVVSRSVVATVFSSACMSASHAAAFHFFSHYFLWFRSATIIHTLFDSFCFRKDRMFIVVADYAAVGVLLFLIVFSVSIRCLFVVDLGNVVLPNTVNNNPPGSSIVYSSRAIIHVCMWEHYARYFGFCFPPPRLA